MPVRGSLPLPASLSKARCAPFKALYHFHSQSNVAISSHEPIRFDAGTLHHSLDCCRSDARRRGRPSSARSASAVGRGAAAGAWTADPADEQQCLAATRHCWRRRSCTAVGDCNLVTTDGHWASRSRVAAFALLGRLRCALSRAACSSTHRRARLISCAHPLSRPMSCTGSCASTHLRSCKSWPVRSAYNLPGATRWASIVHLCRMRHGPVRYRRRHNLSQRVVLCRFRWRPSERCSGRLQTRRRPAR